MKKKIKYIVLLIIFLAFTFFTLKYFNISYKGKLLVSASYSGGLCPNGPCGHINYIYSFGHSEVQELINKTDFNKIREMKYTGICPTAYDGQKVIYMFYTNHGIEEVDSCVTNIDNNSYFFKIINNEFK